MKINKTIKLYIGGKFPRTESGRSYEVFEKSSKNVYANVCKSSRKDFRNSVEAAKSAQSGWSGRTAFNRSQILYRMAEMLEGKRSEFSQLFITTLGKTKPQTTKMIDEAIDAFVYYAGFCDKYQQLSGSVNNINGPFHNFTTPDSMGVVVLVEDDKFSFLNLCARIAAIIAGGNSVVVLLSDECPAVLAPLAEVFATSDLPGGVINLLTGQLEELYKHMGAHREVKAISYNNKNKDFLEQLKVDGTDNMKRITASNRDPLCLEEILDFVEFKTVWHPIGV